MLISIGNANWHLIFPAMYSLSLFFRRFTHFFPPKSPFLTLLIITLSQLSFGILELISLSLQKKKREATLKNVNGLEILDRFSFLKPEPEETHNIKNIISAFFLGFFCHYAVHFVMMRGNFIHLESFTFERETLIFGLLYCIAIEYLLFYKQMYKHKKFSLCLLVFFTIIISIIWCLVPFKKIHHTASEILIEIFLLILTELFFTTKHNMEKLLMDKRYISPYKLVFIEGIGNLCCFIVIMVFYDYIGCFRVFSSCQNIEYVYPFKYFKDSFTNYKYILLMIPTTFGVDVFIILTLK